MFTTTTRSIGSLAVLCLLAIFSQGCTVHPKEFATAEEAVGALTSAARAQDTDQLVKILGSDGKAIISSGDENADRIGRDKFLLLYDEKHSITSDNEDSKTLVIGKSEWPFPIPLVRQNDKWIWDAEAGKEELLNRRIGNNELSAIQVCKAIGDAEHEYALRDSNNDGIQEYAQKIPSDPGTRNGLFWPVKEGEQASPLGEMVEAASAEGYARKKEGPTPYHGYYYRILLGQGPGAPGGALDYVVKGKMLLGFAVLAYPAEYNNSGIMSFIMGTDGIVYQKDLGENTAKDAAAIKVFDPADGWKKAE